MLVGGSAGAVVTGTMGSKELILDQGVEMLLRLYRRAYRRNGAKLSIGSIRSRN